MSAIRWQGGALQMKLTGEPGWSLRLLVSTNLQTWTVLATLTNQTGIVTYTAPAPPEPTCSYRAVVPSKLNHTSWDHTHSKLSDVA